MWREFIKVIVMDVDGVLLDTPIFLLRELYAIAHSLRLKKPALGKVRAAWGKSLPEFLEIVLPDTPLEVFVAERNRLALFKDRNFRVPGVRRALNRLRDSFILAVLTNRSGDSLLELMAMAEIDLNIFLIVQTASDLPRELHKPNPAVFDPIISALAKYGITRREIMYAGDNVIDFQATHNAGLQFAGVLSRFPTTRRHFIRCGVPEGHLLQSIRDLPGFMGLSEDQK